MLHPTASAAGNAIQGLLNWQVYVTKSVGTALARLAGLALGIEGEHGWLVPCAAPGPKALFARVPQ